MTETTSQFDQNLARIAVGAYDDAQDVRTAMMNRVRDIVRKKNEGIPFDEVEEEKDADERDFDNKYKDENLPEIVEQMRHDDKLTEREFDYLREMLAAGQQAREIEEQYKTVMEITETEPIYEQWLSNVMGVSSTLTARLIHQFGYCEDFSRITKMWAYSGLAPGQSRTKGEKCDYNPEAKTLLWKVADCMIKMGDRSRYRVEFYDPYKNKQIRRMKSAECEFCGEAPPDHDRDGCDEFHDAHGEDATFTLGHFELGDRDPDNATPPWSRGHADARARRYLMKKFAKHYWYHARRIQGLETPDEYIFVHGDEDGNVHDKKMDTFEAPMHALKVLAGD